MKYLALLSFTLFLFFLPQASFANESLRFSAAQGRKEKAVVAFVQNLRKTPQTPYLVAQNDLNDDAINEYILRPESTNFCPNAPLCSHMIVAFENYQPILIGQFDAHKILLSSKKTYGIRDVIVYNQSHNDFKTTTATWDPFSFRYKLR